jgi:membrane-associated phospholipid phosphatase
MPRWLAHGLSGVFHPLLVPTYLAGALLWGAPALFWLTAEVRWWVLGLVVLLTFLGPALGTAWLVQTGRASSLLLPDHRERGWPLGLALAGFGLAAFAVRPVAPLLSVVLAAQAAAVAAAWLISRYWLISAHAIAMGGTVALALVLPRWLGTVGTAPARGWLLLALALACAVSAARLRLAAHTPAQVGAGFGLGLAVGLVAGLV